MSITVIIPGTDGEMLPLESRPRHVIVSSADVLNMVTLRIVVNGNRIGYGDNRHNGGCDVGFIEVGRAG